jgi:hypothetical protein
MSNIIQIEPASRKGAHLLIQLFGGPRSGKTLTALMLARGIAGPSGKIGVLDTESGRANLYDDKIPGGYFVGEMTPPFTPERYRLAIEQFVAWGADVLVIDSFSHCWQGPGGVLEMADHQEANGKKGLQKWLKPKVEYRKLIGFLLSTRIHIIFCSRAKQPVEERMVDGKKTMFTLPWEPIQDKQLKYEMTLVLPMVHHGTYETAPDRVKIPGDLQHLFTGQLLGIETGTEIAKWVAGGKAVNHAHELLRKRANDAAMDGTEAFRTFWKGLKQADRAVLQPGLENYQSIAKAADEERAQQGGTTTIEGVGDAAGQTGGQDDGEPARLEVGVTANGEPDWQSFIDAAESAIASAPDQGWLDRWQSIHKAALTNLAIADGLGHKAVAEAVKAKALQLTSKAA